MLELDSFPFEILHVPTVFAGDMVAPLVALLPKALYQTRLVDRGRRGPEDLVGFGEGVGAPSDKADHVAFVADRHPAKSVEFVDVDVLERHGAQLRTGVRPGSHKEPARELLSGFQVAGFPLGGSFVLRRNQVPQARAVDHRVDSELHLRLGHLGVAGDVEHRAGSRRDFVANPVFAQADRRRDLGALQNGDLANRR
jgi:hypothetical protein